MAFVIPKRRTSMVLITAMVDGEKCHIREPYNIVAVDNGDGQPPKTYIEPAGTLLHQPSSDEANSGVDASDIADVFQEVRFYDGAPPFARTRMGVIAF